MFGNGTKTPVQLRSGDAGSRSTRQGAVPSAAAAAPWRRVTGWIPGGAGAALVAAGLFVTIETCFPPLDWTLR